MSFTLTHCNLVRETDDAVLVELSPKDDRYIPRNYWLPLSQVEKMVKRAAPFQSEVTMTDWLASQKDFK